MPSRRSRSRSRSPRGRGRSRSRSPHGRGRGHHRRYSSSRSRSRSRERHHRRDRSPSRSRSRSRDRHSPHRDTGPTPVLILHDLPTQDEEIVADSLKIFGAYESLRILEDPNHKGFYAFIRFSDEDSAAQFLSDTGEQISINGSPCRVSYSRSSRGGSRRKHAPPRDDRLKPVRFDWICHSCNTVNFARRTVCFTCQKPIPEHPIPAKPANEMPSTTLKVAGLPPNTEVGMVWRYFRTMGDVKDVHMLSQQAPDATLFAIVEFADTRDTLTAMSISHTLEGYRLTLSYAHGADANSVAVVEEAVTVAAQNNKLALEAERFRKKQEEERQQAQALAKLHSTVAPKLHPVPQGFSYDLASGFYYSAQTGYYFDPHTGYYCFRQGDGFFYYDAATQSTQPYRRESVAALPLPTLAVAAAATPTPAPAPAPVQAPAPALAPVRPVSIPTPPPSQPESPAYAPIPAPPPSQVQAPFNHYQPPKQAVRPASPPPSIVSQPTLVSRQPNSDLLPAPPGPRVVKPQKPLRPARERAAKPQGEVLKPTVTMQKKGTNNFINKWNQRTSELHRAYEVEDAEREQKRAEREQQRRERLEASAQGLPDPHPGFDETPAPAAGSHHIPPPPHLYPVNSRPAAPAPPAPAPAPAAAEPICEICRRKFKDEATLQKHVAQSSLHRENLAKLGLSS